MRIGVPKEIKIHEYRVGLVPASVRELVAAGHQVLVECAAGSGIGVSDADYKKAGAHIVVRAERPGLLSSAVPDAGPDDVAAGRLTPRKRRDRHAEKLGPLAATVLRRSTARWLERTEVK